MKELEGKIVGKIVDYIDKNTKEVKQFKTFEFVPDDKSKQSFQVKIDYNVANMVYDYVLHEQFEN